MIFSYIPKRIKFLIAIVFLVFIIFSCNKNEQESNKVIVRIRNEKLTLDMLREMIPVENPGQLTYEQIQNYIQRWMDQELMYQEAIKQGIRKDNEELKKILKNAEKTYIVDTLLDSLLSREVNISEQEMLEYYEENKDNFVNEKLEIRALHILVEDLSTGRDVRRRIINGEDFEDVAQETSMDYKSNGRIDLGYFNSEMIIPDIGRILFRQRKGTLTNPLKSQFGYHIFKIVDKRDPNTQKDYEEVRKEIYERLLAIKRKETYNDFIADLKNKIDIKTNFEYLEELFSDSVNVTSDLMRN